MALTKVTGQVIKNTTDVTVGVLTVTNTLAVGGTVSIGGTLTYEDVTNIDSVGLITARNGIIVGSGITLSKDGDGFFTGIVTATSVDVDGGNITLGDSGGATDDRIAVGAGGDIHIYHDGTNSYVSNATGDLNLFSVGGNADDVIIRAQDDIELQPNNGSSGVKVIGTGAVELYHNNAKQLETRSDGLQVDGTVRLPADNSKLLFGAGLDLEIYHSGTHSIIKDAGTGNLQIAGSLVQITNAAISASGLVFNEGGALELYHNGSKKLETTASGTHIYGTLSADTIDMTDNEKILLGDSDDLQIFHDATSSVIKSAGHPIAYYSNTRHHFLNADGSANIAVLVPGAQCELYHNGSKKFETTSNGISVTGSVIPTGNVNLGDSTNSNNNRFIAGASDDLQIYHSSSNAASYIQNSQGNFFIEAPNGSAVKLRKNGTAETMLVATAGGNVELYHDNTKRIETLTDGAQIKGVHHVVSEDGNSTFTRKSYYYSINTNSSVTVTLTSLLGTGKLTVGGYANAGQGAIALHIIFGGAMFATQHYQASVLQESAMQNTAISKSKNATSYVVTITNNSSSYTLNLNFGLESQGSEIGLAFS